ncbi:MAG: general secretion pathway protein, partial [Fuerstiella sp.]|nr:general secretion pathway protein [Fuerstiella sp.]
MLIVAAAHPLLVEAQETPATTSSATTTNVPDAALQFSFDGAPWRDVIQWLADSSDLALHVGGLPTGSFTYSDLNSFTPQEAIDRVNLFLLPQGYSLVRSGKLLSVINLTDPRSMQQLNALAILVTVEQLDQLSDHDVVKCIFPLGELDAEDA